MFGAVDDRSRQHGQRERLEQAFALPVGHEARHRVRRRGVYQGGFEEGGPDFEADGHRSGVNLAHEIAGKVMCEVPVICLLLAQRSRREGLGTEFSHQFDGLFAEKNRGKLGVASVSRGEKSGCGIETGTAEKGGGSLRTELKQEAVSIKIPGGGVTAVAAEEFIATIAGEGNFDVLAAGGG